MLIVRVMSALAKPAIAGSIITASAAGGFFAFDHFHSGARTSFEAVQGHGPRLIVSEFAERRDDIIAIDPTDTARRTTIATVDHAAGYGIFATLAPDGRSLAYTALPADAAKPAPDAPAQAAVVDVHGDTALLADDVDLLIAPVWSPDGNSIVVRKNTPEENSAGAFELLLLGRDGTRATLTTWHTAAIFPIAFNPDGSKLYFATLNEQGSDLYSVAPDGTGETEVAHLSDEISRDWTLSPDGTALAYSVAISGNTPGLVTRTLRLDSGVVADAIPPGETSAQFNPAWKADGELTVGAVKPEGGGDAVEVHSSGEKSNLTTNSDSMDLPLSWSPDGDQLAVRSVQGKTPFDAGAAQVEVVDTDGKRQRVSDSADVLVVGWLR